LGQSLCKSFTQALAQERKDLLVFAIHPGLTNTRMGNLEGMAPERVARVIYQAVCGKFRRVSGSDIKVKFYAQGLAGRILYLMQEFAKKVLGR